MSKRIAIAVTSGVLILAFIFIRRDPIQQHKFDSTLHIVIERAPGGLYSGQAIDVTGRRFTPLLEEYHLLPRGQPDVIEFEPKSPSSGRPRLKFTVIRDESTRAMKFLRGEVDVLYDTLAISKTEWIKKQTSPVSYRVYEHSGLNLSFLGFSLRHPILKDLKVRLALAKAIPVADWAKYKLLNWVVPSTEYVQIPFDPEASQRELDALGFPVGLDGKRFELKYFTTGVRDGAEMALITQEALKKIGVAVEVVTLDSLLYFQKMKKGEADLFSTRWFRAQEQEPIAEFLSTGGTRNYFGYSNPKLDQRLKKNPSLTAKELSSLLKNDLPFFPLYNWKHGLILSPRVRVENETRLVASMDESFRFLLLLGLK